MKTPTADKENKSEPSILLLSGGLDSVTLLHRIARSEKYVHSLIFDYGQRHIREIVCAKQHCESLKLPFTIVKLHRIKGLFQHSILTDGSGSAVVPNRNAVLLMVAASIASGMGLNQVFIGCNKDDASNFPDCRDGFIDAMNVSLKWAQVGVSILAPYLDLTKREIFRESLSFGIDPDSTYSCYEGNAVPCGKCLACVQRKSAII